MIKKTLTLALGGLAAAAFVGSAQPARAAEITPVAYRAEAASKFQNRRAIAKKKTGRRAWVRAQPAQPSVGQQLGLHGSTDPLELKSAAVFVVDQDTNEVLLSKNSQAVLPIASITKLMTALVVVEAGQPLDDTLEISQADVDTEKGSRSRLRVGDQLTRGEMMHLALMASENRAAHVLGRYYPGGMTAVVEAMNRKARALGMSETRYVEPTGLSSGNRSSARDLATLVNAAHQQPMLRELSTSPGTAVLVGHRTVQFRNTNLLLGNPLWEIGLQKTGYISEAGRCLVMQAKLAGRKLIMVLLDSAGRYSRVGDAERIRRWLSVASAVPAAHTAPMVSEPPVMVAPTKSMAPNVAPVQPTVQVPGPSVVSTLYGIELRE
jgi:D-alanyl-D-alanine endopeptidase (penicillin-binding protein 7)